MTMGVPQIHKKVRGVYKKLKSGISPILFIKGLGKEFEVPEFSSTQSYADNEGILAWCTDPLPQRVDLRQAFCYLIFSTQEEAIQYKQILENANLFKIEYAYEAEMGVNCIPKEVKCNAQVPGLEVIKEYVTEEEEKEIVDYINQQPWNEKTTKRRVQHYGYNFVYGSKKPGLEAPPIPEILRRWAPEHDQCTVNEYVPGVGIASHVDTHSVFDDELVVISLLSPIVMDWHAKDTDERTSVDIPVRSKMVFRGESRYRWNHGIASRKTDVIEGVTRDRQLRLSITYRTLRRPTVLEGGTPVCTCNYPHNCDSQNVNAVCLPTRLRVNDAEEEAAIIATRKIAEESCEDTRKCEENATPLSPTTANV